MRLDPTKLKKIEIIYEDDELLAVNKPAGMASQPGADDKRSVLEVLESAYDPPLPLYLCHRLDRGTTGVLLLAKSSAVAAKVNVDWDQSRKIYLAVARGAWSGPERITTPIESDRGPLEAETIVRRARVVEHELGPLSRLVIELGTGRLHQIRKHLAGLGHPILLDDRHGHFGTNKQLLAWLKPKTKVSKGQLLLHAWCLRLPHPASGMPLALEAPLPELFRVLLEETAGPLGDGLADIP